MKITLLLSVALISILTGVQEQPQSKPVASKASHKLQDLAWLEGTWLGKAGKKSVETCYSSPSGGMIVAATKEFAGDKLVMFDFEYITLKKGVITMTPFPFGKKSVDFPLKSLDKKAQKATFENAKHDFPTRFVYHLDARGTLKIRIENDKFGEVYVLKKKAAKSGR